MWWMEELFGYEVINHPFQFQMGLQMGQYFYPCQSPLTRLFIKTKELSVGFQVLQNMVRVRFRRDIFTPGL